MSSSRSKMILAVVLVLPLLAVVSTFFLEKDSTEQSLLVDRPASRSRDTAFETSRRQRELNAPPTVVGVEECARCHRPQAEALAGSGHSRTFSHTSRSAAARSLDGLEFADPERGHKFRYKFDSDGGLTVTIPGKMEKPFPLTYALGSGTNAVTFLSMLPSRKPDGKLVVIGVEHRVSLFPHATQDKLNLTPGHAGRKSGQDVTEFGNVLTLPVLERCIGCHTTEATVSGLTLSPLRENVSCENCHGPGSRHVAAAELHLQNPGHLRFDSGNSTADHELALCGECHRRPEMIEGQLRRDDVHATRFQPAGLMQSRCFLESDKGMRCTTCHNPHATTSHIKSHYVAQCLSCHQAGTGKFHPCPVSPAADCIRCHMPRVRAVHEVSFTDHWIRIRDQRDAKAEWPIPSAGSAGK